MKKERDVALRKVEKLEKALLARPSSSHRSSSGTFNVSGSHNCAATPSVRGSCQLYKDTTIKIHTGPGPISAMSSAIEESRKLKKQVSQLKGAILKLEANEKRLRAFAAEREKDFERERAELKKRLQQKRNEADDAMRKKEEFDKKKGKILTELLRKDERIYFLQEKLKAQRDEAIKSPASQMSPQPKRSKTDLLCLSGNFNFGLPSGRKSPQATLDGEIEYLNRLLEMVSRYECIGCKKLFKKDCFLQHFEKCGPIRSSQATAPTSDNATSCVRRSEDLLEANFQDIDEFELQLEEELAEISHNSCERSPTIARQNCSVDKLRGSSSTHADVRIGSPTLPA